ncbi:hypothetical protein GCM10010124_33750 [Pilimelia terevasa]|uniref:Uncharacterized protein n=1 Tax=Pilimelia terevasa TaxID=53372 RepID=A0A8J3FL58_9ACTN|nr:hypothetical protein [Pilimelia terevasa]GGK38180.1 hypothetical protein GCM10010124_33750 [Pilimelia terevasa]
MTTAVTAVPGPRVGEQTATVVQVMALLSGWLGLGLGSPVCFDFSLRCPSLTVQFNDAAVYERWRVLLDAVERLRFIWDNDGTARVSVSSEAIYEGWTVRLLCSLPVEAEPPPLRRSC